MCVHTRTHSCLSQLGRTFYAHTCVRTNTVRRTTSAHPTHGGHTYTYTHILADIIAPFTRYTTCTGAHTRVPPRYRYARVCALGRRTPPSFLLGQVERSRCFNSERYNTVRQRRTASIPDRTGRSNFTVGVRYFPSFSVVLDRHSSVLKNPYFRRKRSRSKGHVRASD